MDTQRLGMRHIGLLCASPDSPLAAQAKTVGIDAAVTFTVPSGRDGLSGDEFVGGVLLPDPALL
jgi:hypothetical protein